MVGLLQSHTVALDGAHHFVDSFVLGNDGTLQFLSHSFQAYTFLFSHSLHGHSRHHRHHVGHLFGIHHLALFSLSVLPFLVEFSQLGLEYRLTVAIACCQFKVLIFHGIILPFLDVCNFLLHLSNLRWNLSIRKMYARASLVESIDGLVGHEAVCHVPVCQFDTCCQRLVGICHMVMVFVAVLDVA